MHVAGSVCLKDSPTNKHSL